MDASELPRTYDELSQQYKEKSHHLNLQIVPYPYNFHRSAMADALFSFTSEDLSGFQDCYNHIQDCSRQGEDASLPKGIQFSDSDSLFFMEEEDIGHVFPRLSDFVPYPYNNNNTVMPATTNAQSFYKLDHLDHHQQQQQNKRDLPMDCFPGPAQQLMQEVKKLESMQKPTYPCAFSSSLDLLNKHQNGLEKMNPNQFGINKTVRIDREGLSTEDTIRVAGARYIQFSDQRHDDNSMMMHPFGHALSGLSEEETRDVELAHLLLAAADEVGHQQFDSANRLLSRCEWIASERANPLQRVVYYFTHALRDMILQATGKLKHTVQEMLKLDAILGLSTNLPQLTFHQKVPFSKMVHLPAIQALLENITSARKVHVIDLEIRSGVQWTAFMQALADREPLKLDRLKITTVVLSGRDRAEETGKRLKTFAKSLNLPFTFKAIHVSSMLEVKEELFETAVGECVVVCSLMSLRKMLSQPQVLEHLMKVIKNLSPSMMVVAEVEAKHNSPVLANRFIEALFFYSAYFDCLEKCIDDNVDNRTEMEVVFRHGIQNIVAKEGKDRIVRSVKVDVWRAFFSRFRMVEVGFSESCLYQAGLVLKQFPAGDFCSLERNGKGLTIGWKGTPMHSLTAWKFCRER